MGFSRQEHWSGLPFPSPGGFSDPRIEHKSPVFPALQADSLPAEPLGGPKSVCVSVCVATAVLQGASRFVTC